MDYIKAFNKSVAEICCLYPSDETILVLKHYMKNHRKTCYYTALDTVGFYIGIEYLIIPVNDAETWETVGYIPAVKFHEGNPLNGKFSIKELKGQHYTSMSKCYAFLGSHYIYELMRVQNLELHIEGKWVRLKNSHT